MHIRDHIHLLIHGIVAMGVVLCECTEGVHLSSCLRVLEQGTVVNDALYLFRFVRKPLLQVGLVQVLDVLLAFQTVGLRGRLREHCFYQGFHFVTHETTCPDHEGSATAINILKLIFELFS